jgi:hypothetical protein
MTALSKIINALGRWTAFASSAHYAAQHGIAEESAALMHGLRERGEELRKSGGEIYRPAQELKAGLRETGLDRMEQTWKRVPMAFKQAGGRPGDEPA